MMIGCRLMFVSWAILAGLLRISSLYKHNLNEHLQPMLFLFNRKMMVSTASFPRQTNPMISTMVIMFIYIYLFVIIYNQLD